MSDITKSGVRALVEAGDETAILALFDEDPHRVQRFLKRLACAPDAAHHARTVACFRMLSRERSAGMPEFFRETIRRSLWEMNEEGGNVAWSAPEIAAAVVDGIFCKLKEMGIWTGDAIDAPAASADIPTVYTREDVCRVACEFPGVYVPEDRIGTRVEEGQVLGTVIDALEGAARETVKAPCAGLVFSQRSYSSVYPGTLIARIRKERA